MTVLGSGQPADHRDDEVDLVVDDPESDLLDDLGEWEEDRAPPVRRLLHR